MVEMWEHRPLLAINGRLILAARQIALARREAYGYKGAANLSYLILVSWKFCHVPTPWSKSFYAG